VAGASPRLSTAWPIMGDYRKWGYGIISAMKAGAHKGIAAVEDDFWTEHIHLFTAQFPIYSTNLPSLNECMADFIPVKKSLAPQGMK
jgi:hypothetical protein